MALLPRDLSSYRITIIGVADLSGRAKLAAIGLRPPAPSRHGCLACQAAGDACSAARLVSRLLCISRAQTEVPGVEQLGAKHACEPPVPSARHDRLATPALEVGRSVKDARSRWPCAQTL
jgi:hypothetical protein